jgi:uracil-DNA glycosylase
MLNLFLTPDECAYWNMQSVTFTPGVQGEKARVKDGAEELWLAYYRSIFNPARVKVHAMMAEMPKKYWSNLPEAQIIPTLIEAAPKRVSKMMESSKAKDIDSDLDEAPVPKTNDLNVLKSAAVKCRACPLYKNATQVVFGEGGNEIKIVFIGEQPGDQEDMAGKPFIGPAGAVFNQALAEAGIDRGKCYLTNAVKHFKWEPRGKRRIHQKPNAREISACHPWLAAELGLLKPEIIICLGATAARSVFGREMAVLKNRGKWIKSPHCSKTLITIHPSSILRAPDPDEREKAYQDFVADLRCLSETT